ncbi:hypothetical protein D3C76_1343570 [compost metagenome]
MFSTWKIEVKIREPPGVPSTRVTLPSRVTRLGLIDESMRLPGSIALASPPTTPKALATPGLELKSSISSLSKKPAPLTTTPLP